MILKGKILIISYNEYCNREGGFCIVIYPDNKTEMKEINLEEDEINELRNYTPIYKNKTPIYQELLNQYFDNLKNSFEL